MDEALLMQSAVVDVEAASVAMATLGYDTKGDLDAAAVRRSCVRRGVVPTKAAADGSSAGSKNKQRIIGPFVIICLLSVITQPAFRLITSDFRPPLGGCRGSLFPVFHAITRPSSSVQLFHFLVKFAQLFFNAPQEYCQIRHHDSSLVALLFRLVRQKCRKYGHSAIRRDETRCNMCSKSRTFEYSPSYWPHKPKNVMKNTLTRQPT